MSLSVIESTKNFVKEKMPVDPTGHDWYHTFRVAKVAKIISADEGGDPLVIELASLLHDIDDWKFGDNEDNGAKLAQRFLANLECSAEVINHVCEIIQTISFKGAHVSNAMSSLEGRIVQDADRLDAMGPIGIARALAYGGYKGQPIFDPSIKVVMHKDFSSYKSHQGTTINHFHEKLLLLKDKLHTPSAVRIGERYHQDLIQFIQGFMEQWRCDVSSMVERA